MLYWRHLTDRKCIGQSVRIRSYLILTIGDRPVWRRRASKTVELWPVIYLRLDSSKSNTKCKSVN